LTAQIIFHPQRRVLRELPAALPPLTGRPLRILFLPALTADRKRVYSNQSRGQPVHASTHIRKREIVLDSGLRRHPKEMARILVHEVFHFAWVRLSNRTRASYEEMIRREIDSRARGELGWSAEWRKTELQKMGGAPWREYLCESFCDTAAFLYAGIGRHDEFTLAARYRARRAQWFRGAFSESRIPI
jgi:hypothetical protein